MLIQLLSNILFTLSCITIITEAKTRFVGKNDFPVKVINFIDILFLSSNGLRAPPLKLNQ